MDQVHEITSLGSTWLPGDVVLDAKGNLRVRTDHPKWVWEYPNEGSTLDVFGQPAHGEGGLEEEDVVRPLTLLVRNGQAVTGKQIEDASDCD